MSAPSKNLSPLNVVKLWVFPSVVTILAMLIWRDVSELRSDVKALLAQTNIDKTKIESLERVIYNGKTSKVAFDFKVKEPLLFKHEDIYEVNNYLVNNNL